MYDSNRNSFISLVFSSNGVLKFILASQYQKNFLKNPLLKNFLDTMMPNSNNFIKNISIGSVVFNIAGKLTKSAGICSLILKQEKTRTLVKLKSGEHVFSQT